MTSNANEILNRVPVLTIYSALGGVVPKRGNRTYCILHRGDNPTVSISEAKGCFYCFACGEGGGKVALVRRALGIEPQAALEWIANLAGMTLARESKEQQRDRAIALKQSEDEARRLVDFRTGLIQYLREQRDCLQEVYWLGLRLGIPERDEAHLWSRIADYDRKIIWHEEQPWDVIVSIYRNSLEPTTAVQRYRRAA